MAFLSVESHLLLWRKCLSPSSLMLLLLLFVLHICILQAEEHSRPDLQR